MTGLWVVTGAALVLAVVALIKARRAAARLTQLSDMYWELKYQHLEFKKQVERISGTNTNDVAAPSPSPPQNPRESFVPLTSLRR